MQRRNIVGALVVVGGITILAAAWPRVYRPSALSAVLGMKDVAPKRGSICHPVVWLTRLGPIPQGQEFCDWFSSDTTPRQTEHQELEFDLTRRVVYAKRSWGPRDGSSWRRSI